MKNSVTAVVVIFTVLVGASVMLIDTCYAGTDYEIQIVQHEHDVVLSISDPSVSVAWDLGDGRVIMDSSVQTTFKSGLWKIKAVVDSTETLERWVGVYDTVPLSYAECNSEYRYGVFTNLVDLLILDENGNEANWLKYDRGKRVLHGAPEIEGMYYVWFGEKHWTIAVTDTGAKTAPHTEFTATVGENTVIAYPTTSHDTTSRHSWSIRDLNNNLVGYHEGRNFSMDLSSGYYVLSLQTVDKNGSVSYSQLIFVDGDVIVEDLEENRSYIAPLILGIVTVILLMVATMTFNPVAATLSVVSAIATILMVI